MIIEVAFLPVKSGQEVAFEVAFDQAKDIISQMPGFLWLTLSTGLTEQPEPYLLQVGWERLEDHTKGFRGSPEYQKWKELLHHFYDPFPEIKYYKPVQSIDARSGNAYKSTTPSDQLVVDQNIPPCL